MAQKKTTSPSYVEGSLPDHMRLWDQVQTTDPEFTKPLKQFGGKFTTVQTMYNCRRATQLWGPAGQGWGTTLHSAETIRGEPLDDNGTCAMIFVVLLSVWWRDGEECYDGIKQYGSSFLLKKDRRGIVFDDEAPKKAMTDALGKSLSYFGFSGDIYLGMWDDNKYVEGLTQEKIRSQKAETQKITEHFITRIKAANDRATLDPIWGETKALRESNPPPVALISAFEKRAKELNGDNDVNKK